MPAPSLPTGIFVASLTPFHTDASIDEQAFVRHTQWLVSQGCDGVLLFGTTGEGFSLTVEERLDTLETLLDAGLSPERLLVGTGASALPDAVRLTHRATALGVGGVLVLPPFHFCGITAEGVFRTYDHLIQRVGHADLRLYFYHHPKLSGVPIPFPVISRLQESYPDQIAGIKDSSGEWDHTEALCRDFPDLQVFAGSEALLLRTLDAGGAGCISATANVTAPLAAAITTAWRAGNHLDADQETLTRLRTAFGSVPTIPALKQLLADWRETPSWATVRPPLTTLSDENRASLSELDALLTEALEAVPTSAS